MPKIKTLIAKFLWSDKTESDSELRLIMDSIKLIDQSIQEYTTCIDRSGLEVVAIVGDLRLREAELIEDENNLIEWKERVSKAAAQRKLCLESGDSENASKFEKLESKALERTENLEQSIIQTRTKLVEQKDNVRKVEYVYSAMISMRQELLVRKEDLQIRIRVLNFSLPESSERKVR